MVIYAVSTSGAVYFGPAGERVGSASVGQLFMAGMVPGIILAIMLSADHVVSRLEEQLSADAEGDVGRGLARVP